MSNQLTRARFVAGGECNLKDLYKTKVRESLSIFFREVAGDVVEGHWGFESDITVGAGMSSSTSDIISALRCVGRAMGVDPTLEDIATCLSGVERSDPVFIDVPCLYLSQEQKVAHIYRPHGKIYCVYGLDINGVDTSSTKDPLISYYLQEKSSYEVLLNEVRQAFSAADKIGIIRCSTSSAVLSQGIFPKKAFDSIRKNIKKVRSDGIITAHTGSLLGYLYASRPSKETLSYAFEFVKDHGLRPGYGEIF